MCFPDAGAALSAAGALISELRNECRLLHFTTSDDFDFDGVGAAIDTLRRQADDFAVRTPEAVKVELHLYAEARYPNQVWEIEVPLPCDTIAARADVEKLVEIFHREHQALFAYADLDSGIEVVSWSAKISCALREGAIGPLHVAGRPRTKEREVHFAGGRSSRVAIQALTAIPGDESFDGPTIIETPHTSIVIDDAACYWRLAAGSLLVDLTSRRVRGACGSDEAKTYFAIGEIDG